MSEPKLKPCPFCGGRATPVLGAEGGCFVYFVRCLKCSAQSSTRPNEAGAIAAWSRRYEPPIKKPYILRMRAKEEREELRAGKGRKK